MDAESCFSPSWLERHHAFLHKEHIGKLARRLVHYYDEGVPNDLELPHFDEEVTPLLKDSFSLFENALVEIEMQNYVSNARTQKAMAKVLETVDFKHILLLMGQRVTSATIQGIEGLPVLKQTLLENSFKPYNKHVSIAVRAWEKHVDRSEDNYWGKIQGSPMEKEEKARELINKMIDGHTWWNVFYHYKHELVCEIRVASGHGMRWAKKDNKLIGFLEPFL